MKNLHIKNSYDIWDWVDMKEIIQNACLQMYGSYNPKVTLNRSYQSMYIEWWLHNIGYYITKPFCSIEFIRKINLRFRDVDINELI
jgi:hypothetical protein